MASFGPPDKKKPHLLSWPKPENVRWDESRIVLEKKGEKKRRSAASKRNIPGRMLEIGPDRGHPDDLIRKGRRRNGGEGRPGWRLHTPSLGL